MGALASHSVRIASTASPAPRDRIDEKDQQDRDVAAEHDAREVRAEIDRSFVGAHHAEQLRRQDGEHDADRRCNQDAEKDDLSCDSSQRSASARSPMRRATIAVAANEIPRPIASLSERAFG